MFGGHTKKTDWEKRFLDAQCELEIHTFLQKFFSTRMRQNKMPDEVIPNNSSRIDLHKRTADVNKKGSIIKSTLTLSDNQKILERHVPIIRKAVLDNIHLTPDGYVTIHKDSPVVRLNGMRQNGTESTSAPEDKQSKGPEASAQEATNAKNDFVVFDRIKQFRSEDGYGPEMFSVFWGVSVQEHVLSVAKNFLPKGVDVQEFADRYIEELKQKNQLISAPKRLRRKESTGRQPYTTRASLRRGSQPLNIKKYNITRTFL